MLSFNYKNYSPVCGLDLTTGFISSSTIPTSLIKQVNSKTTTNNTITLNVEDLNDVLTSTTANGDVIMYNSSTSQWNNSNQLTTNTNNISTLNNQIPYYKNNWSISTTYNKGDTSAYNNIIYSSWL